jgi:tellurite resistance protein TerC
VFPVTDSYHGREWFVRVGGRLHATPLFLCLAALVFADIAFAIDSIPAAFGITRDPFLIWMGNVFALLGLRALFVLVEGLIKRFRYLDETIAIILGVVAVKLMLEDVYKAPPEGGLAIVLFLLAGGIVVSMIAERRDVRRGVVPDPTPAQARLSADEDP